MLVVIVKQQSQQIKNRLGKIQGVWRVKAWK